MPPINFKPHFNHIFLLFVLIFLVFLFEVRAQYTVGVRGDSTFLLYKLEEVVVYGERYIRSPSLFTEIPAVEIRARNGGTVADILRRDPGLTVTSGPKAETETRIRGFDASDLLVLVDGRPINPGYYGKAYLSMLPKDHIAKIKVMKGPTSVAYGSNGMGGVINIITKNGFEKPHTRLDTEFGHHAFRRVSLNHSHRVGRFSYWISGYENHSDGFELSRDFEPTPSEDGGLRKNSDHHKAGVTGKLGFRPSDRADYILAAGYHWAKKGCAPTANPLEQPQFRRFPKWERYSTSLSGQWQITPDVEVKSILYIDGYHDRFKSFQTEEMSDDRLEYDSLLENWTIGGSIDAKLRSWKKHQLHLGVHFRRDLMNKKSDVDDPWYSHDNYTGSGFVEDRFRPWQKTGVTFGLGYHVFGTETKAELKSHWSPMVSLNQALPFDVHFHASWANAIRFPTMHQLYSETSGNENLKPEEADKMEIGLERFFIFGFPKGWSCQLEGAYFHNTLKNLIYRASRTFRFQNIEKAKLLGWELQTHWTLPSNLFFSLGYVRIYADESSMELMEEMPEHRLGFRFSWKTSFGSELSYEYNYYDERTTHIASLVLMGYHVHHCHFSQHLYRQFKFHLWISNILDESYQEELGYPAPGRQISMGFSWVR